MRSPRETRDYEVHPNVYVFVQNSLFINYTLTLSTETMKSFSSSNLTGVKRTRNCLAKSKHAVVEFRLHVLEIGEEMPTRPAPGRGPHCCTATRAIPFRSHASLHLSCPGHSVENETSYTKRNQTAASLLWLGGAAPWMCLVAARRINGPAEHESSWPASAGKPTMLLRGKRSVATLPGLDPADSGPGSNSFCRENDEIRPTACRRNQHAEKPEIRPTINRGNPEIRPTACRENRHAKEAQTSTDCQPRKSRN